MRLGRCTWAIHARAEELVEHVVQPRHRVGLLLGQQFIDWLISPEGQEAIADYKINGEQLFYPNASDPNA